MDQILFRLREETPWTINMYRAVGRALFVFLSGRSPPCPPVITSRKDVSVSGGPTIKRRSSVFSPFPPVCKIVPRAPCPKGGSNPRPRALSLPVTLTFINVVFMIPPKGTRAKVDLNYGANVTYRVYLIYYLGNIFFLLFCNERTRALREERGILTNRKKLIKWCPLVVKKLKNHLKFQKIKEIGTIDV